MIEIVKKELGISKQEMRENILAFEDVIKQQEGHIIGSVHGNEEAPIEHEFGKGLYVRKLTMPAGMLNTSKIHRYRHAYFIIQGDVSIITDDKVIRVTAPHWGMTEPGTKRLVYTHEETVWITTHGTENTDLEEIEKELIMPSFDELENLLENEE